MPNHLFVRSENHPKMGPLQIPVVCDQTCHIDHSICYKNLLISYILYSKSTVTFENKKVV